MARMKLKEVHRTSTFAWSPAAHLPQLATGTVAGALDASFSDESRLEIWTPNFLDRAEYDLGSDGHPPPSASVSVDARCAPFATPSLTVADDDEKVQSTRLGWRRRSSPSWPTSSWNGEW